MNEIYNFSKDTFWAFLILGIFLYLISLVYPNIFELSIVFIIIGIFLFSVFLLSGTIKEDKEIKNKLRGSKCPHH